MEIILLLFIIFNYCSDYWQRTLIHCHRSDEHKLFVAVFAAECDSFPSLQAAAVVNFHFPFSDYPRRMRYREQGFKLCKQCNCTLALVSIQNSQTYKYTEVRPIFGLLQRTAKKRRVQTAAHSVFSSSVLKYRE